MTCPFVLITFFMTKGTMSDLFSPVYQYQVGKSLFSQICLIITHNSCLNCQYLFLSSYLGSFLDSTCQPNFFFLFMITVLVVLYPTVSWVFIQFFFSFFLFMKLLKSCRISLCPTLVWLIDYNYILPWSVLSLTNILAVNYRKTK